MCHFVRKFYILIQGVGWIDANDKTKDVQKEAEKSGRLINESDWTLAMKWDVP